jgi:NDP-sugar pyrophosphorylase family protein
MKVLILAAGYGTRLGRDLQTEEGRAYQHLVGLSKPLLPIGGKPLIDHWMFLVQKAGLSEDNVIVVVSWRELVIVSFWFYSVYLCLDECCLLRQIRRVVEGIPQS